MRAVVGIQARLGSKRLPGKVLMDLAGKPLLQRVWEAVGDGFFRVVLCPDTEDNDRLVTFLRSRAMLYRRGSEPNCLERYFQAALEWEPECLVRVCGDAPFLRHEWIERAVEEGVNGPVFVPGVLHAGPCSAWDKCYMAMNTVDEHAGHDWFRDHGKTLNLDVPDDYLTVNTKADLDQARKRFR